MNPRLLKNYLFYRRKGYDCEILAFKLGNWTDQIDIELVEQYDLRVTYLDASRNSMLEWLKTSFLHLFYSYVEHFSKSLKVTSYVSNKRSIQILGHLKKSRSKYDLIEAHTLATLYPAYKYASQMQVPFIFDIEDFHPYEHISANALSERKRREKIMRECLLHADHITTASPLISEKTKELIPQKANQVQTINNSFYQEEFVLVADGEKIPENSKVKLVWFSQYISFGRGLELVVEALQGDHQNFELTLIGSIDQAFADHYRLQEADHIKIIPPLKQLDLHSLLGEFDVGLALELSNRDANRDICLTNKLFAYVQSGLFVLATNTSAQIKFIESHEDFGVLADQHTDAIGNELRSIQENIQAIRESKEKRYHEARALSFDVESQKLLEVIESCLS